MGIMLITLGNAIAPAAGASAQSLWWPAWVLVAGVLIALAVALVLLRSLSDTIAAKPASRKKEFAHMLCEQVWRHTDFVNDVFAAHMRLKPESVDGLRVLLRGLREDLSAPVNFVDQLRQPTESWPSYVLFQAFTAWGGQIRSMISQLEDQHRALSLPIDKAREKSLLFEYQQEQAFLQRAIDKLRGQALDICAAAKPHLGKAKKDEEDDHPDCPCCKRRNDKHGAAPVEYTLVLPPAPPPAPPPPPPPPAATHCCVAPRICSCSHCVCSCHCVPVAPPAIPAKPA